MKKILCIALAFVLVLSLAGCKARTEHTADTFTEVMEAHGYTVYDVSETTETNKLKATILVAVGEDFQVEYFQFDSDDTASSVFANNKGIAEKVASTSHASVSSGDFEKYTQTTSEMYWFIARVGNTMIYCVADKEHKDAIVSIMQELDVK